jgi:pimeloyl-ACP methyl ester carboxylesterase
LDPHFADEGTGPPVLLLHGWPDAARGWDAVGAGLRDAGRRVITPDNRGCGATRFRSAQTLRDGSAAALADDVLELADAHGLDRFAVVGHDWGARTAYTLACVAPERLTSIVTLALPYQPGGRFAMPSFGQARAFWYQWLMYVDAGAAAVRADPISFARAQWDTWSPAGWFRDEEFRATAAAFANPDWVDVTLHAYRSRFLADEPLDPRYDSWRSRVASVEVLDVPTLVIHGALDRCDEPDSFAPSDPYLGSGRRALLPGVGHFPHREAPEEVLALVHEHLTAGGEPA